MFEQSTLTSGPPGKRVWNTVLGMTSQTLLVGCAVLAPMIWPQVMKPEQALTTWLPPVPLGHKPKPDSAKQRPAVRATHRLSQVWNGMPIAPKTIPPAAVRFDDPPMDPTARDAVVGGTGSGIGVPGSILPDIVTSATRVPEPPVVRTTPHTAPETEVIKRVAMGGLVHPARLIHKVEPQYPGTARAIRVSGEVALEIVIGVDGRVREVTYKSGSPLLARAAIDAVRQWIYEPTTLNGVPVEIVGLITVKFILN